METRLPPTLSPTAGLDRGDKAATPSAPFKVAASQSLLLDRVLQHRAAPFGKPANDLNAVLERDARGYETIVHVLGGLTLVLGLVAIAVLP